MLFDKFRQLDILLSANDRGCSVEHPPFIFCYCPVRQIKKPECQLSILSKDSLARKTSEMHHIPARATMV